MTDEEIVTKLVGEFKERFTARYGPLFPAMESAIVKEIGKTPPDINEHPNHYLDRIVAHIYPSAYASVYDCPTTAASLYSPLIKSIDKIEIPKKATKLKPPPVESPPQGRFIVKGNGS